MFGKLFKKKEKSVTLVAPLSGKAVSIDQVPDDVFSQKMLGDGVAVDPTTGAVLAPCDGVITKVFGTNHAFTMKTEEGLELIVHFGVDTVNLGGVGFGRNAEEGAAVKAGDQILTADLSVLKESAKSIITSVVVSNMDAVASIAPASGDLTAGESVILEVTLK